MLLNGAGKGFQGKLQVNQGLLKVDLVSELPHVRITIHHRPWSNGAKYISIIEFEVRFAVSSAVMSWLLQVAGTDVGKGLRQGFCALTNTLWL